MKTKDLFIFLYIIVIAMPSLAKTYLVSVGIADYPGNKQDLRVSAHDAEVITSIFKATKNAETLTITNVDATQAMVLSTISTTFAMADSDDTVIFYFSGHGAPGAFICYDGILRYQQLFTLLKNCKARNKFIIADACFSGKMRTGKKRDQSRYNPDNIVLFLSSRTGEKSIETPFANSLFTWFLERGLRGGADVNYDKIITAKEIYQFVHQGVIDTAKGIQHPVMWGKFDSNTPIIKWKK